MPKTSKEEVANRVSLVAELILRGYTPTSLVEMVKENLRLKNSNQPEFKRRYRPELDWGVEEITIRRYYKQALAKVQEIEKATIEQDLAITLHQYNDLYRRCLNEGRYSVAARILHDKAQLLGLDAFFVKSDADDGASAVDDEPTAQVKLPDGTTIDL